MSIASLHQSEINAADLAGKMFSQKCAQIRGDSSHIAGRVRRFVDRGVFKQIFAVLRFYALGQYRKTFSLFLQRSCHIPHKHLRRKGTLRHIDQIRPPASLTGRHRCCRKVSRISSHHLNGHDQIRIIRIHIMRQL